VEARPVDPVEPRFTDESEELPARMKQGNSDKGGFLGRSEFGKGRLKLGGN
jgi:hypothetical protein